MNLHRKLLLDVFSVRNYLVSPNLSGVPTYPKRYQYIEGIMSDWVITYNFEMCLQKEPTVVKQKIESNILSLMISVQKEKEQVLVFRKTKLIKIEYIHYEYIRDMFLELRNAV